MIFRVVAMLTVAWCAVAASAQSLPSPVADALAKSQVPLESVSVIVKEVGASDPVLALNSDKAMNPASVIKLLTTYAGLELLGPAYVWKTEVFIAGEMRGGTLHGDLVLKGSGDPRLTVERFWMLLKQLRERGLTSIRGNLILDRSYFEIIPYDPAVFDGESLRAYNVGADPLLLNFKTVRFSFSPSIDNKSVSVSPDIRLVQLEIVNRVKLTDAPCGEWRDRVVIDVQTVSATQTKVAFSGSYPRNCGEKTWNVSLLDHTRFVGGAFASLWRELGGTWHGDVLLAPVPANARLIATQESAPLAEIVRDINKYSNNVMARQLFLTLSAELAREPGSASRSATILKQWLARKNIPAPELAVENGSGLSRGDRVSATTLAQVLDAAWKSSVMPELMSSLSLVGIDGTLRRRARNDSVAGQAHIKSGTLGDARAMAGYVLDAGGRRWIVAMMINHPNASLAQPAQDALLNWTYAGAGSTGAK